MLPGNLIIPVVRCETVYFMMRRKLLHRMEVCGATSCMIKDEMIVGENQVDGTRLLNIFIHRCIIFFCHTCITSKMLLHPVTS